MFTTLELFERYDLTLFVIGLGVLGLTTLLHRFQDYPFSFPIVALALGYVVLALPLGLVGPDPQEHEKIALHLTELGVILSLMGVGLKIDRKLNWRTWSVTWRLLAICMPLTIAGVAFFGWWMLGLAPASAVLLGAALAPTDPVLASDVQVGKPEDPAPPSGDALEETEDEVRFALTSEAGLNDSLAFPFTWLALVMLAEGASPANWLGRWLVVDVAYRIGVGVVGGLLLGWVLAQIIIRLPVDSEREKMRAGMGALAATLLLYSMTEFVSGYGFLATFVGALTIRRSEESTVSNRAFHAFAEQSEQLVMTGILIALGGAVAGGLLDALTWKAALLAVALIFVVRPVAGLIGLVGCRRLPWLDRVIVSFFGIRGIGSLYYLSFALHEGSFDQESLLWAICGCAIILSVCIHGVAAAPVMQYRERRIQR